MISDTNTAASDLVANWPEWPAPSVALHGAAGVGKSHLAHIWSKRTDALRISAATLDRANVDTLLGARALAVEDLDRGISDEKLLFHLLNHARDGHTSVLLTTRSEPGDLDVSLPDLRSRLRALPVVRILPPDDALLNVLLVKLFADRQLLVGPQVIRYLLAHMERSAECARRVVAEIDKLALALHRKPTAALAGEALRNISSSKT